MASIPNLSALSSTPISPEAVPTGVNADGSLDVQERLKRDGVVVIKTALADPDWVKIAAIAFFQLVPLLSSQGIFELGANPLAPPPAKGKAKKA